MKAGIICKQKYGDINEIIKIYTVSWGYLEICDPQRRVMSNLNLLTLPSHEKI
jgi:hypothetical protein